MTVLAEYQKASGGKMSQAPVMFGLITALAEGQLKCCLLLGCSVLVSLQSAYERVREGQRRPLVQKRMCCIADCAVGLVATMVSLVSLHAGLLLGELLAL